MRYLVLPCIASTCILAILVRRPCVLAIPCITSECAYGLSPPLVELRLRLGVAYADGCRSCSGSDTKLQIDVTLARICIAVKVRPWVTALITIGPQSSCSGEPDTGHKLSGSPGEKASKRDRFVGLTKYGDEPDTFHFAPEREDRGLNIETPQHDGGSYYENLGQNTPEVRVLFIKPDCRY